MKTAKKIAAAVLQLAAVLAIFGLLYFALIAGYAAGIPM